MFRLDDVDTGSTDDQGRQEILDPKVPLDRMIESVPSGVLRIDTLDVHVLDINSPSVVGQPWQCDSSVLGDVPSFFFFQRV